MGNKKIDEMMENVVISDELKNRIRKQTIGKGKVVKFRKHSLKKVALVATLCVTMLGAMTVVAANNAEKIGSFFMDLLGYTPETQEKLEEEGFLQNMEVSYNEGDIVAVTHDGITVAVKETIADKNVVRVLIQVRAEEGIKLDENCYFENFYVKGIHEDSSSLEYGMAGTENIEGQWYIVNINNANGEGLKSGDIVELTLKNIMRTNWNTEILCELEDGATAMVDGEEYVMKKIGHADELEYGGEELLDSNHWSNTYPSFVFDTEQYAYAFVNVSDGNVYDSGDGVIVRHSKEGDFLLRRVGEEVEDEIILEEAWKLSWKLTVNEDCVQIPINETIEANNLYYYIDNVQITPLSFKVEFSKEADGSLLYSPLELKVFMKDGSVCKMDDGVAVIVGHQGEWHGFCEVMDIDNIDKISIEGKEYSVGE